MLGDTHIRLDTAAGGEGLSIEGDDFGPLPMLATSLALCTASVIYAYAETAHLDVHGFAIEVRWDYAENPHRVGHFDLTLHLPERVPAARHRAILRAADTCTVHQTLTHSPTVETAVQTFASESSENMGHHHAEHRHDHVEHRHDHEV
jgi:uncharacterized OsmC-like protein